MTNAIVSIADWEWEVASFMSIVSYIDLVKRNGEFYAVKAGKILIPQNPPSSPSGPGHRIGHSYKTREGFINHLKKVLGQGIIVSNYLEVIRDSSGEYYLWIRSSGGH